VSRGKGAIERADREQTVAIDRFEADVEPSAGGGHHPRKEEAREVVGHHDCCVSYKGLQQTPACARAGLDVAEIGNAGPSLERSPVVVHSRQHELVKTVGGPRMVCAERLEHHERLPQIAAYSIARSRP
jgi:hypothetical protein